MLGDSSKLKSNILSPTSETQEPTQYTATTLRSVPENPENGADKPVSANATSVPAIKPTGPQYAVKTSGWQSSNQPGNFFPNFWFYLFV